MAYIIMSGSPMNYSRFFNDWISFQLLNFRDEEFDDETDRGRFAEIINLYRQILASKRIDALDMRIKSGWWGDHKNAYSAGKIKPQVIEDLYGYT